MRKKKHCFFHFSTRHGRIVDCYSTVEYDPFFVLEQLLSFVPEFFFQFHPPMSCSHGFKSKNLFRFACNIAFVMSKNVSALN
jgi:hypothetical protein